MVLSCTAQAVRQLYAVHVFPGVDLSHNFPQAEIGQCPGLRLRVQGGGGGLPPTPYRKKA